MSRRTITTALACSAFALSLTAGGDAADATPRADDCRPAPVAAAYEARVLGALRATEDVWGNALLAAPGGPTYEGARRYLRPLFLARAAKGAPLTASGVHYVPFSGPVTERGAGSMALHVADGSQILSQRAAGRSLTLFVGQAGDERYGSCRSRLGTPRLADGYLPILETRYVDAGGVRYRQESFATRIGQTRSLVSFVALTASATAARPATVRFEASEPGAVSEGVRLARGESTILAFSPGATARRSSVTYGIPRGSTRTVYVAWLNSPGDARGMALDQALYESAKWALVRSWRDRLGEGASIEVPEARVEDAYRSLLVQNLGLTWRYSVGNPYQQLSFPEVVDAAEVMTAQGFAAVGRAMLLKSVGAPLAPYPRWKMGQQLVGSALYYRLSRDRSYVERVTPALDAYVAALGSDLMANPRSILSRERFSSDIKDPVYGLHAQAIAWQGLRSMATVWAETGQQALATEARKLASRLGAGLRAAVRASQRRLPDRSLFVPVRLLDDETPYESVTESRPGGYWNLVAPYAFASGLFAPGSPQATGILRYLRLHGTRLLGLVRAGAYSLYGLEPVPPASGVNPVYGLNAARFLADNDLPDRLVLSLYGQLAAGMAPGTFVSGEGVSVAPLGRESSRAMYLPPNGASNASFLETLRLMLIHESRGKGLEPTGLDLAFSTPRGWLAPGKRIAVRNAPTSFGALSYTIVSRERMIEASVEVPSRAPVPRLRLRLRLPEGKRITSVTLNGLPYTRVSARSETIDLTGQKGRLTLVVGVS
jgi:hypothetical protein